MGATVGATAVQNPNAQMVVQGGTTLGVLFETQVDNVVRLLDDWEIRGEVAEWVVDAWKAFSVGIHFGKLTVLSPNSRMAR